MTNRRESEPDVRAVAAAIVDALTPLWREGPVLTAEEHERQAFSGRVDRQH